MARVDTAQLTSQIFTAGWRLALQPAVLANIYRQKDVMATIIQKQNKTIEIRFKDANGKPQSIYPGRIAKRDAQAIGSKIDHIVGRQIVGAEPDHEVAQWLAKLAENSGKLYAKLVKKGLAPPRQVAEPEPEPALVPTLKEWTDRYIQEHPGADGTIEQLEIVARGLCKKFGGERRLDDITPGDAEDFRKWLQTKGNERKKYKTGLAHNTVRRRIGRSKEMFRAAVKHRHIEENPFADELAATTGNPSRLVNVPADWIEACIRKAPCEDWRIILAFARYAGMRSHETRIQKWEDIDLANNVMMVRSNKNPPVRRCPIFRELRPHLLRAREMAPEGAVFVQTRYDHQANILTTLKKIITAAGLVPWQKPMQNLRATRETELLAHFPAKDVTSWLGNSPTIAHDHYAMATQASFDRAVIEGGQVDPAARVLLPDQNAQPDGAKANVETAPQKTPPNPPPTVQDKGRQTTPTKKADAKKPLNNWVCLASALGDLSLSYPARTRT